MRKPATLPALVAIFAFAAPATSGAPRETSYKPCASPGAPVPFTSYWLGERFESLKRSSASYECQRPTFVEPIVNRTHYNSITYRVR